MTYYHLLVEHTPSSVIIRHSVHGALTVHQAPSPALHMYYFTECPPQSWVKRAMGF